MDDPRFRRSPAVMWRRVGAEVLLAVPGRQDFLELSATGGAVWDALAQPASIPVLAGGLARRYGGPAELIAADVRAVVERLEAAGAAERVGAGG